MLMIRWSSTPTRLRSPLLLHHLLPLLLLPSLLLDARAESDRGRPSTVSPPLPYAARVSEGLAITGDGANKTPSTASSGDGSRRAFKKDLMVVLPVMQGNSDLSHSSLQMLYTKTPVTAIVGEGPPTSATAADVRLEKRVDSTTAAAAAASSTEVSAIKRDQPTAARLVQKSHKSPLDYGYPESFKFVQELNELPKNHKPEWAQTEAPEREAAAGATPSATAAEDAAAMATKGDPFQMFESVKPLEINKLLSPKVPATPPSTIIRDAFEEGPVTARTTAAPPPRKKFQPQSTESPHSFAKRPVSKRPQLPLSSKKPPKNKGRPPTKVVENDGALLSTFTSVVSANDNDDMDSSDEKLTVDLTKGHGEDKDDRAPGARPVLVPGAVPSSEPASAPPAGPSPAPPAPTVSLVDLDPELYVAARYTTLLAETTKAFLPTPYTSAGERDGGAAIGKRPQTKPTTSTKRPKTKPTTSTSRSVVDEFGGYTPLSPNLRWSNASVNVSAPAVDSYGQMEPSDLVTLTKILDEPSDPSANPLPPSSSSPPPPPSAPKEPFKPSSAFIPPPDVLTNDAKSMLIALGILESEQRVSTPSAATSNHNNASAADSFLKNLFAKAAPQQQPVTPTIDPNSYVNFKKIPIDFEKQKDVAPVSDDMRDLLASFGLLSNGKSALTRVSRQRGSDWSTSGNATTVGPALANRKQESSATSANETHITVDSLPREMRRTLENLGLLEAAALVYHPSQGRSGHVFQPTIQLEEFGGDERKVKKISDAIGNIRNLSKIEENLSPEEVERELQKITELLREENFGNLNNTDRESLSNATTTPSVSSTSGASVVSTPSGTSESSVVPGTGGASDVPTSTSTSTPAVTTARTSSMSETARTVEVFGVEHVFVPSVETSTPKVTSSATTVSSKEVSTAFLDESELESPTKLPDVSSDNTELKLTMNPPNPLSPEELQNLLEFNRNDALKKRQQPNDTTTSEGNPTTMDGATASERSPTTAATSTTTVSTNNAPLPDLAASFGGGDEMSADAEESSTPRPNGLYFYLDWNTFLNVGEEDRNPVRIRFAPRAGNARNFLPITVP